MTKSQFLQSLETELKSRRLPDAGEILEEYEQHFAFKLADGYTEQEIARNLGSPFEIAAQFDPQSPKREAPGGRAAIIAGLGLASVPAAGFFLLLAGWGIIVACSSLVSLAVAACLLGGISPWGLIPAMPGGIAAVYGIAMAALSILSASGCVYFAALFRQLVLACARCFKNAGCAKSWYATTEDGLEQQFALNYLAGFLLTYGLFPALSRAGGRVIMTASQSHKGARVRWDDLMLTRRYNPLTAYKQSKLCDVLFARALNDRYAALGIRAYAVDPGLARTEIGNKAGGVVGLVWSLRKRHGIPPSVSAEAFARLCIPAQHPAGLYHDRHGEKAFSRQVTAENAARLFSVSERLCGISYQEGT